MLTFCVLSDFPIQVLHTVSAYAAQRRVLSFGIYKLDKIIRTNILLFVRFFYTQKCYNLKINLYICV